METNSRSDARNVPRRRVLQGAGVTTIAGLAGCAGVLGSGSGGSDPITVAYMPIYPDM